MDAVEEIKDRLAIEEVVGRYVDLKRSGASYKGLCPFHQEKTPSFYVTPSRGTYHCFGCSRGGDVISFVMEMEKLSFPEALSRLADQAGVALPDRKAEQPSLKGKLHEANAAAAAFFQEMLKQAQGARARGYLEERRFGEDAIEQFELGYAPESREAVVQHLRRSGFEDRVLLAAGLARQDDNTGQLRDYFRGRLMFPIRDRAGKVVGFGGRTLGDAQPKYLNSAQTEIFDKSSVLFGIHRAQDTIRQAGRAVLVEGYLDAIRAHVAGYRDVVASLGTAVTPQQLTTLSRMTEKVILALDPDPAGQAAAARTTLTSLAQVNQSRGRGPGAALDLRIARLPEGHGDPDELIRDQPELWERTLERSVAAFDFYFRQTLDAVDRSSEAWRQDAVERLLPVIQQFAGSAVQQATWLSELAKETGADVGTLLRSLTTSQPARPRRRPPSREEPGKAVVTGTTARASTSDPQDHVERKLLAMLLKLVVVPTAASRLLSPDRFQRMEHRVIAERLLAWAETGNYDFQMLRGTLPEGLREYADELYALDEPLPSDEKVSIAVAFHLARLQYFRVRAQLTRVKDALRDISAEDRAMAAGNLGKLMSESHQAELSLDKMSQLAARAGLVTHVDQGTIDQDSGSW